MKKIIIGFTGLMAAGKGTATEYLVKKYGAKQYKFSNILRDMLTRIHLEHSRDFMIKMSETLRQTFGEDILASVIAKDTSEESAGIVVIDGIRRLADIAHLSQLPNFVLVEIFAEPRTRYERLTKRRENADDATKTYEQFLADHQRTTELSIPEVADKAQEKINNNGSLPELCKQIDEVLKKYQNR